MKKLKLIILIFCVTLSIPLTYFILMSYQNLEQEEIAELQYFSTKLFNEIQNDLAGFVQKEEQRAVDEYNYHIAPNLFNGRETQQQSPLSQSPHESFILGYFQNNPDGSFQTPVVESIKTIPPELVELIARLEISNERFNQLRTVLPERDEEMIPGVVKDKEAQILSESLDKKYFDYKKPDIERLAMGQAEKRVESISPSQALNITQNRSEQEIVSGLKEETKDNHRDSLLDKLIGSEFTSLSRKSSSDDTAEQISESADTLSPETSMDKGNIQVEVAPMQSVHLNNQEIFIFRRIEIDNQIYRQGFVLSTVDFLYYLRDRYFAGQPIAEFTNLALEVLSQGRITNSIKAGAASINPKFSVSTDFPRPFSFLHASLACDQPPRSTGRNTLNIMMVLIGAIILLGLFSIYHNVRTVVELSERRSTFVSSVTHELKTPLTNIRMYIEMLEQGMASDPEREQEYFRILESEGSRLSRLINNVLEFSKLEKRQHHFDLKKGTFEEVIQDLQNIMGERINEQGFELKRGNIEKVPIFSYDREVMVQTLINLIENSMKFGKNQPVKEMTIGIKQEGKYVAIQLSDTGPGIPRHALKKVFNDFYRVESDLTRSTGGTGIGLALVKKIVIALGGKVKASNNIGPGCTITIYLPI